MVFKDGVTVDKLTGFQGLSSEDDPDKWHTGKLQQWISTTGAIKYTIPSEEMRAEMKRFGIQEVRIFKANEIRERKARSARAL